MFRAAAGVLLVFACCAQREPAAPPPPRPSAPRPAPVQPAPAPPRVWIAGLLRSGGFAGGMMSVSVRSDRSTLRCSPQQQALVESAVAAAHPEVWKPVYSVAPTGLTDQFHYTLTLNADGRMYQAAWSTEASPIVPPDLLRLSNALNNARGDIGKRCP